jgi:hypothetical protein
MNAPRCALLYYFTLSNARRFYLSTRQGESTATQWVKLHIMLQYTLVSCQGLIQNYKHFSTTSVGMSR